MPRAKKRCSTCPNLVPAGTSRCPDCERAAAAKRRADPQQAAYTTRAHRAFREAVLARNPICVACHAAPSTVADHYPLSRRELTEQGLNPNDPARGRGLCHRCHSIETAKHQPGGWHGGHYM